MKRRTILVSVLLFCATAHAGDELTFDQHGFSLTLADEWLVREIAPFYEKYLAANEKALGENAAKVLSQNTQVIFKANRGELGDDAAVFTCLVARNIDGLEEMTGAQRAELIEGAALNSYRLMASRGLDVKKPVFEEKGGIEYASYRMTQNGGEHTTDYKIFIASGGMVICAGGALSEHLTDIVFMNNSIRAPEAST